MFGRHGNAGEERKKRKKAGSTWASGKREMSKLLGLHDSNQQQKQQ